VLLVLAVLPLVAGCALSTTVLVTDLGGRTPALTHRTVAGQALTPNRWVASRSEQVPGCAAAQSVGGAVLASADARPERDGNRPTPSADQQLTVVITVDPAGQAKSSIVLSTPLTEPEARTLTTAPTSTVGVIGQLENGDR